MKPAYDVQHIRLPEPMLRAIDKHAAETLSTRSQAIRALLERALAARARGAR